MSISEHTSQDTQERAHPSSTRWLNPARLGFLKKWLPKSLYGRAMLIIVLPIAIMQIAVAYTFFDAHWQTVTSRLSEGVAGDIAMVLELYEQVPSAEQVAIIKPTVEGTLDVSIALEPNAVLPTSVNSSFFRVLDRTLRRALSEKLKHEFWFDTTRYPALRPSGRTDGRPPRAVRARHRGRHRQHRSQSRRQRGAR